MSVARSRRRRRAPASPRATLADVARVADVSIASASRALSHPELVSEALCARVQAAAGDLAYVRGGFGIAAAAGVQRCVGAIVVHLDDGVTAAAIDALAAELAQAEVSLLLAVSDGGPEATTSRIAELLARGASAIALCGVAMPALPQLLAHIPIASLDGGGAPDGAAGGCFSLAQALELGVLYLADLGHTRVALLDVRNRITVQRVKAQGAARGVDVVDDAAASHFDEPALASILQSWLSQDRGVTGAVCGSDRTAAALLRACARVGIAVPAAMAVIGFGDTELSRHTRPALTSLRISAAAGGVALAQRLMAALVGGSAPAAPLPAKLVVRESTMPPRPPPDR